MATTLPPVTSEPKVQVSLVETIEPQTRTPVLARNDAMMILIEDILEKHGVIMPDAAAIVARPKP